MPESSLTPTSFSFHTKKIHKRQVQQIKIVKVSKKNQTNPKQHSCLKSKHEMKNNDFEKIDYLKLKQALQLRHFND